MGTRRARASPSPPCRRVRRANSSTTSVSVSGAPRFIEQRVDTVEACGTSAARRRPSKTSPCRGQARTRWKVSRGDMTRALASARGQTKTHGGRPWNRPRRFGEGGGEGPPQDVPVVDGRAAPGARKPPSSVGARGFVRMSGARRRLRPEISSGRRGARGCRTHAWD